MKEKEYYSLPYISNSALSDFKISPLYCYKRMMGEFKEETSYLTLGKQIHLAVLEPELFDKYYTVLDYNIPKSEQQKLFCSDYIALVKEGNNKKESAIIAYSNNYSTDKKSEKTIAKNYNKLLTSLSDYITYLSVKDDYKEVLSKSKFKLIESVKNAIQSHVKAKELFKFPTKEEKELGLNKDIEAYSELPIIWEFPIVYNDEATKCKSLIDRVIIDHKNKTITLIDLKTTSKLGAKEFKEHFEKTEINRQLSFYWMAINYYFTKFADYEQKTYIVACNTREPVECRVLDISDEYLDKGNKEIFSIMPRIVWHINNSIWDHNKEYYENNGVEKL